MASPQNIALLLPHPNLFVKPLPPDCDEHILKQHFGVYGEICSVRVCSASSQGAGLHSHAFVRFINTHSAYLALNDQPRSSILMGQTMIVKLADADMAPKLHSGQSECEWVYIRGLPSGFPNDEIVKTFSNFGSILDMKYFASTAQYKGTGALIRYSSVENARQAITAMNDAVFPGCLQPLVVRFADSPAEKAAKMNRKGLKGKHMRNAVMQNDAALRMAMMQLHGSLPTPSPLESHGSGSLPIMQTQGSGTLPIMQTQGSGSLPGMQSHGSGSLPGMQSHGSGSLSDPLAVLPPAPHASETNLEALATNFDRVLEGVTKGQHQGTRALPWTLQVKSVPTEGGKLWLYEKFAPYGAILSVTLTESSETSSLGHVSFVDCPSAVAAKEALHGTDQGGERSLEVLLAWETMNSQHPSPYTNLANSSILSPLSSGLSDSVVDNVSGHTQGD
ncbi:ELAV-like protein 2 [Picochlorum sp. SENEW3]|nr:ELAV-like protein 2 [Picochlorum sp. SENEW3]WPT18394.1 ELAV-like protein 2 [Picochlorum sp. SENEW3]